MCRIAGIISKTSEPTDLQQKVKAMCNSMKHGGPDGEGVYLNEEYGICLGHRRLALLDLTDAGQQPMSGLDGKIWITYNGEVYNFRELRSELEALGHYFVSGTDTEVILKAYIQWNTEAFARFNGMFAFSIVDLRTDQVHLVRDAAGIKPLYYSLANNQLSFASEVKAFKVLSPALAENPEWRLLLLAFGHLPEPYTTLRNVFAMPKGHYLTYDLRTKANNLKPFRRLTFVSSRISSKKEATEQIREKLKTAVNRHLIADAPIGVFLSGGIDSSLITLLAAQGGTEQLQTLSTTFADAGFSEEVYQQAVIDQAGCHHTFYRLQKSDLENHLESILGAYDQPSNDGINSWFISKCAKENGLKAVLSGLGSDEVFGGYPSFSRMPQVLKISRLPSMLLSLCANMQENRFQRLEWLKVKGSTGLYLAIRGFYSPMELSELTGLSRKEILRKMSNLRFQPQHEDIPADEYACWLEFNRYMQNQLLKDSDYMSMQHGLELRMPFLDQQLLDTVFSIDPAVLYKHSGLPKQLLIDSFKDELPEQVWNRNKMGFTFPFQNWLGETEDLKDCLSKTVNGKKLFEAFTGGQLHWSKLWTYYLSQRFAA